jgi:alpha-L-rhamnosidase
MKQKIFFSSGENKYLSVPILSLFFLLISFSCKMNPEKGMPVNLKCEYLIKPVGIDNPHPRLLWQLSDERPGAGQTAFRILIGTDSASVSKGKGNTWNSGKINSGQNFIRYEGDSLKPFTRYYWSVISWNQYRKSSDVAPVAFFETGMMKKENWKGSWISDSRDINLKPAPYFRKTFEIKKKVKSARQYIAVAGLYELYLNGNKCGTQRLDPAYTRFDRRTLYATHDVTPFLKPLLAVPVALAVATVGALAFYVKHGGTLPRIPTSTGRYKRIYQAA